MSSTLADWKHKFTNILWRLSVLCWCLAAEWCTQMQVCSWTKEFFIDQKKTHRQTDAQMRAHQARMHTVAEKQNKLNKLSWARKAQTALTDHLRIWQAEAAVHVHWNTHTQLHEWFGKTNTTVHAGDRTRCVGWNRVHTHTRGTGVGGFRWFVREQGRAKEKQLALRMERRWHRCHTGSHVASRMPTQRYTKLSCKMSTKQ